MGGSRPPAVRTVPHSCGSLLIVIEDLRGTPVAGCPAPAIAAFFSIANQVLSSCPQPSNGEAQGGAWRRPRRREESEGRIVTACTMAKKSQVRPDVRAFR